MRRRLLQVALLTLATSAGLFGAEYAWRFLVQGHYERQLAAFQEPQLAVVPGEALYGLRADLDHTQTIVDPRGDPATAVHYRTNRDALRWHDVWPPPNDPLLPRILFVGDSYTFGTAVGDGEAFPHQTQRALQDLGVRAFAINAGVPGHNSEQQLANLRTLLPRYRPRHVVLGFVTNDAEPPTYVPLPPATRHRSSISWLFEDCKPLLNGLTALCIDDRPVWRPLVPDYDFDYRRSWAAGSPRATAALAAIAAMHTACAAAGAEFTVVVLPDFTRNFDDTYPFGGIHAQVVELGRSAGFRTLDTLPELRATGAVAASLRVAGDGHPNAEGQRRLATQIAGVLAERLRG